MAKKKAESTQPGNPRKLTIKQHIHSRAAIARFADDRGLVTALRRNEIEPRDMPPTAELFCAHRVWSQKAEAVIFRSFEDSFQREVDRILSSGSVEDHTAVSAYFSIWHIRSKLALEPPEEWVFDSTNESPLSKDEEEILEKKGIGFMRGSVMPSRLVAELGVMPQHDFNMNALRGVRWGVLRGPDELGLLCSDQPGLSWFPVTRSILLSARHGDQALPLLTANFLNNSAFHNARAWLFGHPDDVRTFLHRNPAPWTDPLTVEVVETNSGPADGSEKAGPS